MYGEAVGKPHWGASITSPRRVRPASLWFLNPKGKLPFPAFLRYLGKQWRKDLEPGVGRGEKCQGNIFLVKDKSPSCHYRLAPKRED
jgi:hypothetical protein